MTAYSQYAYWVYSPPPLHKIRSDRGDPDFSTSRIAASVRSANYLDGPQIAVAIVVLLSIDAS